MKANRSDISAFRLLNTLASKFFDHIASDSGSLEDMPPEYTASISIYLKKSLCSPRGKQGKQNKFVIILLVHQSTVYPFHSDSEVFPDVQYTTLALLLLSTSLLIVFMLLRHSA